jgi:hypothetical protein
MLTFFYLTVLYDLQRLAKTPEAAEHRFTAALSTTIENFLNVLTSKSPTRSSLL